MENCISCTSVDECISCNTSYFPNGNKCEKCANGCERCSSSTQCIYCTSEYYFINSTNVCSQCPSTEPYVTSNSSTLQFECSSTCPTGYKHDLGSFSCFKCKNYGKYEYYNDSEGKCQRCPSSCSNCNNFLNCTSCNSFNYDMFSVNPTILENGERLSVNSKGCLSSTYYHNQTDRCEKCLYGYELNSDGKCVKTTMPDTKFILDGFNDYTVHGQTFKFGIMGVIFQGLIYESKMQFDFKNIKNNQNTEEGSGTCVLTSSSTADGGYIEENREEVCIDDYINPNYFYERRNYYSNIVYLFVLECEGISKEDIKSDDEISITSIKLTKLNKNETNNESIQSFHLLNYPLNENGTTSESSFYNYHYNTYLYGKWYRLVANISTYTFEGNNAKLSLVGTIIDDEEINNLNFSIPLLKLNSDELLNKNASCILNKKVNERNATMECTIENLNNFKFTFSPYPANISNSFFDKTYLSIYIEDKADLVIEPKKSSGGGLSGGAVAGIVVGSIAVVGIVAGVTTIGIVSGTGVATVSTGATSAVGSSVAQATHSVTTTLPSQTAAVTGDKLAV